MTIVVTHTKTLIAPDSGTEDKIYGSDYVSASSHSLAGVADVAQGGTGVATVTSGQLLYGNGTSALQSSSNLVFSSGNLVVNGAPSGAAGTDKLQVNGNGLVGGVRLSSGGGAANVAAAVNGSALNLSGASNASGAGGDINATAGTGTTTGGNLIFSSGNGGTDSGLLGFSVGTPSNGNAGDLLFVGADGLGTSKNGTNASITLGNKSGGAGVDGVFTVGDNASSGLLTYAPVGDLLTVGNLKFGTYTAGVVVQAGYINVTDSGGTTRRLLVG